MKPVEFVLWLNGAAELVGEQPPTPEQWAIMREKLGEAVGGLVAARLLERAEETLRTDERRKKEEAERAKLMEQMLEAARPKYLSELGTNEARMEAYRAQTGAYAQRARDLANALPAGTITLEVPEPPKPGLFSHIIAKATA